MTRERRDPEPEPPHVDAEMLADILSFTSVDFVIESIDEFLVAAAAGLDTIAEAIPREDRSAVERFAHRLRGSCAVTGAMRLADRCGLLEEAAPAGSAAELARLLAGAREELDCVRVTLEAERHRLATGSAGGAG